jgi:hypothetical protein
VKRIEAYLAPAAPEEGGTASHGTDGPAL